MNNSMKFVGAVFIGALVVGSLVGCGKVGAGGALNQAFGNWAQVQLPNGCIAQQISAESSSGVAVLCKDGRVFH
jgi:hypothetical protein